MSLQTAQQPTEGSARPVGVGEKRQPRGGRVGAGTYREVGSRD